MNELDTALAELVNAWRDEGPVPEHHRRVMVEMRRTWPTLYYAVIRIVEVAEPAPLILPLREQPRSG